MATQSGNGIWRAGLSVLRWLARLTGVFSAAAIAGFVAFAVSVEEAAPHEPGADAIVVLTGDAERLHAGIALLESLAGDRLLITGVNAGTTRDDIKIYFGAASHRFDCCVDLGWSARDTAGNAAEAATWAREWGYQSLIVVTAHYHMPRAILELGAALPGVTLVPYPVAPEAVELDAWWRDPATLRLLAGEYVKYLASLARLGADKTFG